MNRLITEISQQIKKLVIIFLTGLLLGLSFNPISAQAFTINEANIETPIDIAKPSTSAFPSTDFIPQTIVNPLEVLITKTRSSWDKTLTKTNEAIANLSQQLDQATTETDLLVRKQIKKDLENKQDSLENAADSIDDLAEKWQKIRKTLAASDPLTQSETQTQLQEQVQKTEQTLNQAAKAINQLADQTEKAKKKTVAGLSNSIKESIETVSQALEEANQAIQAFTQPSA